LNAALLQFADRAGIQIFYDAERLKGRRTNGVQGTYTVEQALGRLLAGTQLYRFTSATSVTLEPAPAGPSATQATPTGSDPGRFQIDPTTVEARKEGEQPDRGFKAQTQNSATKTPLSIRETPQAISVITQESLKARQVVTLAQALETAAGVGFAREPGPFAGRNFFGLVFNQIRGMESNELGVLEDGFLAPQVRGSRDLAIYERIEVVKGPSSVLYGRGSAGGFINLVSKKPWPEFKAGLRPTIGSFDFYRLDADVTGPLFNSNRARGRLVLAYEDSGSFTDFVESERVVVAPSLEFDLTDSTRLLLQGTYQDDAFVPHYGFPLRSDGKNFKAPDVRRSLFFGVPGNKNDNNREFLTGNLQLTQKLGDRWLATLRLNAQSLKQSVAQEAYADGGLSPEGDTSLYSGVNKSAADLGAGELRLNGDVDLFGRPANITLGAERSEFNDQRRGGYAYVGTANIYEQNFNDFPPPAVLNPYGNDQDFKGTGVYGQMQIRPFDRFSILFGVRYDWADTISDGNTNNAARNTRKDEEFTWRVGTTFDVTQQVSLYGLYARSFTPLIFSTGRNGILEPETGEIYEEGLKTEWFDGQLGINAAVFRIDRDNVPIPDPNNRPGENFSINAGLQRADGLELEINGAPLPGWNLSFSGILLDAEFIERDDPNFGNSPRNAADWQVGLYTSYESQSGPLKNLGLGAGLFAVDDRPVMASSSGTIDGYKRADLHTFYNGFEHFRISLQVRNLFDEDYLESLGDPSSVNYFGAPTAVLLRLEGRLDNQSVDKVVDAVTDVAKKVRDVFK
jgi:TonB-dependent siderophore receptor